MNFKKNGGFTLVELIVVIAILGILAGIGIPAYVKYVEKTQIAVEEQNINMFHNAYVVACVGNSIDPEGYTPSLDWRDGNFYGLTAIPQRAGENPAANAVAEFNAFFGFDGTKSYSFKHHSQTEVAKGIESGISSEKGYDKVLNNLLGANNAQNLADLMNSVWGTKDAEFLTGKVDWTADIAEVMLSSSPDSSFSEMIKNCGDAMMEYMGITGAEAQQAKMQELMVLKMEQLITSDPAYAGMDASTILANYLDPDQETSPLEDSLISTARDSISVNNAILSAAKNSESAASSIIATLNSSDPKATLVGKVGDGVDAGDTGAAMGEVALTYAMYMSYAERNNIQVNGIQDVLNGLTDSGFKAYVNNTDENGYFQADMDGYLGSMSMINNSVQGNEEAVTDVLLNGFGNSDLVNVLNQAMNSTKK